MYVKLCWPQTKKSWGNLCYPDQNLNGQEKSGGGRVSFDFHVSCQSRFNFVMLFS